MAVFKPYKILKEQLASLPIKEGQLIITTDDKKIYLDESGTSRICVGTASETEAVTYTLEKSGTSIQLKGSDGSTTQVTDTDTNTTYTLTQDGEDGHKLTFKPSNGNVQTITIPDNDTKYTGSNGVTVSGTAISNSGVRAVSEGTSNGSITVNTNGTSAQVAVHGLKGLAYKDSLTATDVGAIASSTKGKASGVAELDLNGKVPTTQLPSYVDDVIEYDSKTPKPETGEEGKIYVDKDTNKTYRWGGTSYVEISASLALGNTASTAYRGDRGETAYNHSQLVSGNPHKVTKADVGLGNVENTKDSEKHVAEADSATESQDAITSITRSGTTFTAHKRDGSTFTFTQQDNNTTYTLDSITGTLAVAKGGTGATSAAAARKNLGLDNIIVSGEQTSTSSVDGGSNVYTFTDSEGNESTFTVKNGSKGSAGAAGAKGDTGTGIKTVTQTTTSTADGGTNEVTVTLTDGTSSKFQFKNGSKGSAGTNGTNGKDGKGISSTKVEYQVGTSGTSAPTSTWSTSVPSVSAGQYLWTRTTTTYTDNSNVVAYSVARNGTNGSNGAAGAAGKDGVTPTITAKAGSAINTPGTPTVTASTSGTTVTLTFDHLKGATGAAGQNATTTAVASTTANGLLQKLDGNEAHYLRGDGTWATPPNTTYTAGTGIGISGASISNAGVRSIAEGTTNGAISVNTNGTTATVKVHGLGAAAYMGTGTTSSTVALGNHTHSYAGSSSAGGGASKSHLGSSAVGYPILATSGDTGDQALSLNPYVHYSTSGSASDVNLTSTLTLGNSIISSSLNYGGAIELYTNSTGGVKIVPPSSMSSMVTQTLPSTAGTILNSGTTSYTATVTSGTKIGEIKINGTTKNIYIPSAIDQVFTQVSSW